MKRRLFVFQFFTLLVESDFGFKAGNGTSPVTSQEIKN